MAQHKINRQKLNELKTLIKDLLQNKNNVQAADVSKYLDEILEHKKTKYPVEATKEEITLDIPSTLIAAVEKKYPDLAGKMKIMSKKSTKKLSNLDEHSSLGSVGHSGSNSQRSTSSNDSRPIQFTPKLVKGEYIDQENKSLQDVLSEHNKSHNADELGDRIKNSPDKINFNINGEQISPDNIKAKLHELTNLPETDAKFICLWKMLAPTEIAGTGRLAETQNGMPSQESKYSVNYNVTMDHSNNVHVQVTYPGYFDTSFGRDSKKNITGNFKINLTFNSNERTFNIARHFTPGKHLVEKANTKRKPH